MLAVIGGKGGVGRTTTALGLGAALAREGRRPIVVDADRWVPDLHAVAGMDTRPGVTTLATGQAFTPHELRTGLAVVPARPATAPTTIARALATLRSTDRPVVVDCPAGGGPDAVLPLRFATAAVVVTTPTPSAVRDAAKSGAQARALTVPVRGTIVTKAEEPGIAADLEWPVLGCVPPADRPLDDTAVRTGYAAIIGEINRQNA